VSSSIDFSFPHTHRRLITFSFFFLFLWNLITREKKREREKGIVVVFGKVQNFFLSTVIIEMNLYFTFSSLASLPSFFLTYSSTLHKQTRTKISSKGVMAIYEPFKLFRFSLLSLFHNIVRSISYTNIAQCHSYAYQQAY